MINEHSSGEIEISRHINRVQNVDVKPAKFVMAVMAFGAVASSNK